MNKGDILETPPLELLTDNGLDLVLLVEAIPELRGDEEILAPDETLVNRALDAPAGCLLIAVI